MNRRLVYRAVLLGAMLGLVAAAGRAQDSARDANSATASAIVTAASGESGVAGTSAAASGASSTAAAGAGNSAGPGGGSNTSGPAAVPAGLATGWGWNFLAAYDFLDSGLAIGAENDTCTLCLGRDLISGWHFGGTRMFTENFGITFDYSGHNTHGCYACGDLHETDIDEDDQFLLGGLTLVKPLTARIRLFAEAFAGTTLAGARNEGPGKVPVPGESIGHHWGPSMAVGGGAEVMFKRKWGVRIFQLDYIWSDFNKTTTGEIQGQWGSVNDVRMSAGIIMHLGGGN